MVETEASKRVRADLVAAPGSADRSENVASELRTHVAKRIGPLLWLNLVCLDAPAVAVSWQWIFAKTCGVSLTGPSVAALFLTAWLIYLADRFGDSLGLSDEMPASLRQRFCLQHRKLWVVALPMVAIADAAIISRLDFYTFVAGLLLGSIALVYLAANHWVSRLWQAVPIKELIIGFLFAGGMIASFASQPPGVRTYLAPTWFLFACLCSLNCMCIARWESSLDRAQNRSSLATAWPALARKLFVAALALALAAAAFGIFHRASAGLSFAISLSAIGLALLDSLGERFQPDLRTAWADLVLLTPALFFVAPAIF